MEKLYVKILVSILIIILNIFLANKEWLIYYCEEFSCLNILFLFPLFSYLILPVIIGLAGFKFTKENKVRHAFISFFVCGITSYIISTLFLLGFL